MKKKFHSLNLREGSQHWPWMQKQKKKKIERTNFYILHLKERTRHCQSLRKISMNAKFKNFKNFFYILDLKEWTRHCQSLSEIFMAAQAKKKNRHLSEISMDARKRKKKKFKNFFFFIYSTLKNRLDTVYLRVKSQWMQKQNERANE